MPPCSPPEPWRSPLSNPDPQLYAAAPTFTGSAQRHVYTLGQQIGAGGNGVVYTVARRPELVAKIQKHALSRDDIDKLDVLVRAATPDLLSVAAWPMDCLRSRPVRWSAS